FLTSMQGEIVVTGELIREMRMSQKMSQEELSADICTQETLSRIENEKRSPNTKKLYQMFQRLGLERERYYGFIVADDYELYEKVRLYKRSMGREETKRGEQIFDELAERLDLKYVINNQFIETSKIQAELKKGTLSYECAYEELKKILNYTMKNYDDKVYRVPFRQEALILNQMARCLRKTKKEEAAIDIYKQLLERYNNSIVSKVFHSVSAILIYINYTGLLEVMDYLDESEKIGKEGIRLMLDCQRGDIAGLILGNLTCVYEKRDTKKDVELAKSCLGNSYYLLDLYLHEYDKAILKEAYEKRYQTSLD
ncbi:MAG: helix-turn-helix domain-containing protein, partial [Lachnospiraceae bacterium]|nr:helix-turn-helix domain-containing protein [Lachnospiraceae bacterium]